MLADVSYAEAGLGDDPDASHLIVCDNRLTVAKRSFYVDRAARGCRIHLIHLSDEWTDDDVAVYDVCVSVFRNYWSPTYLAPIGPNRTHIASAFDAADGLPQDDYRRQLEKSLFAPCPTGFSTPDTFRLYESLEAGCIPIVEHGAECDYFGSWLGRHPIPTVADWNQAPALISQVLASGEAEQLRQACITWWDAKKREYQDLFSQRIGSDRL